MFSRPLLGRLYRELMPRCGGVRASGAGQGVAQMGALGAAISFFDALAAYQLFRILAAPGALM